MYIIFCPNMYIIFRFIDVLLKYKKKPCFDKYSQVMQIYYFRVKYVQPMKRKESLPRR